VKKAILHYISQLKLASKNDMCVVIRFSVSLPHYE